uniref:Malonyl-CoA decarboxylase N-terminal domain-containing protein n=1 Tax=Timema bartmani TaxID=61472 RepID=A0A7R9F5C9_9NEOP|nr:unnamed protein product [Timema bartmani]
MASEGKRVSKLNKPAGLLARLKPHLISSSADYMGQSLVSIYLRVRVEGVVTVVKLAPLGEGSIVDHELGILERDFNNSVTNKAKRLISRAALRMDGNGSPNRRMGLCQRLSPARYLNTAGSPIDEMGQTGRHGGDSTDYYFGSNEDETPHRPSTVEDEVHVKNLLKEILTYRESNVSNWIIESKVKRLSAAYKSLLKPHKEGFLKELSRNHAVDHHQVQATARTLIGLEDSLDERQVLKAEERLKMQLTPQYSWLFIHLGRLERGVKFLVDMRT